MNTLNSSQNIPISKEIKTKVLEAIRQTREVIGEIIEHPGNFLTILGFICLEIGIPVWVVISYIGMTE